MEENFDLKKTRNNLVAKDNRIIQNSRYSLSTTENKAVLYLISKIQPDDEPGKVYSFNFSEFRALIKWNSGASYEDMKKMLEKLSDMRWWIDLDDDNEALVRWFNIIHRNKRSGEFGLSFHEDMFPFLLNLQKHLDEEGHYYTTYKLQNITLMKHKYSSRIYEILKSYQYNNRHWTFENGTGSKYDLQRMISSTSNNKEEPKGPPKNWSNWSIFQRDVLDPAQEEINKYTDITIDYIGLKEDIHHRKTRGVRTIFFTMDSKTAIEQKEAEDTIDGEYVDVKHAAIENEKNTLIEKFNKKREEARKEEEAAEIEKKANQSEHPELYLLLNQEKKAGFDEKKINQLYRISIRGRVAGNVPKSDWELFAIDLITYYYEKIEATPEETKTNTYQRLVDCVKNDYDCETYKLLEKYKR